MSAKHVLPTEKGTMVENSAANSRLWRRAAGLGAFGFFCSGILLAVGLGRIVLLVSALAALAALVAGATWIAIRYRETIAHALVEGYRTAAPAAVKAWRGTRALVARSSDACLKAGRHVARQVGPAMGRAQTWLRPVGSHTLKRTRAFLAGASSVVGHAHREALVQLRAAKAAGSRQVSKGVAVAASDIAVHRERVRAARRPRQHPVSRRRELPPRVRSVGWEGEPTEDDALKTHDEIDSAAARKQFSAQR